MLFTRKPSAFSTLILKTGAAALLLMTLTDCGSHKSAQSTLSNKNDSAQTAAHTAGAAAVYNSPHPANCGRCNTAGVNEVASCVETMGTPVDCEGTCIVAETVVPKWNHEPPSSGPQYDAPTVEWYEHSTPIARGTYVRNLAHGFVVLAYNCPQGCDAELAVLRHTVQSAAGSRLLLTPDPLLGTGTRFAAIAWTWIYTFEAPDEAALLCFIRQHEAHGIVSDPT